MDQSILATVPIDCQLEALSFIPLQSLVSISLVNTEWYTQVIQHALAKHYPVKCLSFDRFSWWTGTVKWANCAGHKLVGERHKELIPQPHFEPYNCGLRGWTYRTPRSGFVVGLGREAAVTHNHRGLVGMVQDGSRTIMGYLAIPKSCLNHEGALHQYLCDQIPAMLADHPKSENCIRFVHVKHEYGFKFKVGRTSYHPTAPLPKRWNWAANYLPPYLAACLSVDRRGTTSKVKVKLEFTVDANAKKKLRALRPTTDFIHTHIQNLEAKQSKPLEWVEYWHVDPGCDIVPFFCWGGWCGEQPEILFPAK
eukprot:TRINITY_DN23148_c0_g1_i1.p1 TRINITY_DN23148_c0_g1~~TRINITY_DN23148_c0_g1_i1.p1  ORF type:complete len:309 (-),score=6.47 TRINITY_DN23148_c0_g1_i1:21-947(-)